MLGSAVLLALILALVLSGPWFPFSRSWGYWPISAAALVLAIWIGLIWLGWIVVALPGL